MSYYQCKRCSHICKQKIEMIRHLQRKNKCKNNILSYNYSDQEVFDKSLIKIKYIPAKSNNIIKESKLQNTLDLSLNNEDIIHLGIINKIKLLYDKKNSEKNTHIYNLLDNQKKKKKIIENLFICDCCLKQFSRKYNLQRHKCKLKINQSNYINENITILNFNILPFEYDWNINHITKYTYHSILLSNIMYSSLLNIIFENEKNLNVFIEYEIESAIIFSSKNNKFIYINLQYLIDNTMNKLHKLLHIIYNNILNDPEFILMKDIFKNQKNKIDEKYVNYKNINEIQDKVKYCIFKIYNKKKEDTLFYFNKNLLENNKLDIIEGY